MSPALLTKPSSLTPREAVIDTVTRLVTALDYNDLEAFRDTFLGEESIMILNGSGTKTLDSLSSIVKNVFDLIGPMDSTHMLTNPRVHLKDGADTAVFTSFVLAQHCEAGKGRDPAAPKWLVGGSYEVDLVRTERNEWKVKKYVVDVIWNQGDSSVMAAPL
jgi:hypothetical protein